jgi:hypothetical protein
MPHVPYASAIGSLMYSLYYTIHFTINGIFELC